MQFTLPMDSEAIMKCIPHRDPFVMIDSVIEMEPRAKIVTIKKAKHLHEFLRGHFPGNPIVPGVLIVEGIAQSAAVLTSISYHDSHPVSCFLTEISSARFRKIVGINDELRYEVLQTNFRKPFLWFEAKAFVGEEIAAIVKLSAQMK